MKIGIPIYEICCVCLVIGIGILILESNNVQACAKFVMSEAGIISIDRDLDALLFRKWWRNK